MFCIDIKMWLVPPFFVVVHTTTMAMKCSVLASNLWPPSRSLEVTFLVWMASLMHVFHSTVDFWHLLGFEISMAIGTDECLFMKVVVLSSKFANSFCCNLQIGSTVHIAVEIWNFEITAFSSADDQFFSGLWVIVVSNFF